VSNIFIALLKNFIM